MPNLERFHGTTVSRALPKFDHGRFLSLFSSDSLKKLLLIMIALPVAAGLGWWYFHQRELPSSYPAYREYAYITNGKSNTVSVIDLRTFRPAKTLRIGAAPTGITANSKKNEIYVVNSGSANVSVIDAERNGLHKPPVSHLALSYTNPLPRSLLRGGVSADLSWS